MTITGYSNVSNVNLEWTSNSPTTYNISYGSTTSNGVSSPFVIPLPPGSNVVIGLTALSNGLLSTKSILTSTNRIGTAAAGGITTNVNLTTNFIITSMTIIGGGGAGGAGGWGGNEISTQGGGGGGQGGTLLFSSGTGPIQTPTVITLAAGKAGTAGTSGNGGGGGTGSSISLGGNAVAYAAGGGGGGGGNGRAGGNGSGYAGGGTGGWAPIFSTATNTEDANGWTRYRPTQRSIENGKTLSISLKLNLDRTGYTVSTSNAIRIGLFRSSGNYLNNDNHSTTNTAFLAYTGYVIGCGPSNIKIGKRTSGTTALISSTTAPYYTELASNSVGGFGGADEYNVGISLKKTGSSLDITSLIYGTGFTSKSTATDNSPITSFDTLVFFSVSNNVASLAISNPIAVYS
jgi:hypothetical protein